MLLANPPVGPCPNGENDLSSGGGDSTYVATSWVKPIINKHMPVWKEGNMWAGLRQAVVATETRQPHSRLFPEAMIIQWLMKPSGEALSPSVPMETFQMGHYGESRLKRECSHTCCLHHHIHLLSWVLPKGAENKTIPASETNAWRALRYDSRGEVAPQNRSNKTPPTVPHRKCWWLQLKGFTTCLI